MVLEFRPPQDLINAYLTRPSPGEQASEAVNQALQTYAQSKAQQQQAALAQQAKDIEMAKGLSSGGQDFQTALDQIRAGRAQPQAAPGTSLIDRARAFFAGSQTGKAPDAGGGMPANTMPPTLSTGTSPSPMSPGLAQNTMAMQSTMPAPSPVAPSISPGDQNANPLIQEYRANPAAFKQQHGTQGLDKLNTQINVYKGLQGMEANDPASFDEVKIAFKGAGRPDLGDELIKNAQTMGQNTVQRKSMDAAFKGLGVAATGIRGSAVDSMADTRKQQLHLKTAEDYEKGVNPATAPGGSLVGIAGKANARADRALQVLRNPKMTYQDLSTVVSDISGIFQGGVPHEQSMRDQKYGTILERIAAIQTSLSGKPATGMVAPELRDKLKQVITDVKRVDNKVIEDNMKSKRNVFKSTSWAKENPTVMDDIENNIRGQYLAAGETDQQTGPHGPTVTQNGHTYTWNGTAYE